MVIGLLQLPIQVTDHRIDKRAILLQGAGKSKLTAHAQHTLVHSTLFIRVCFQDSTAAALGCQATAYGTVTADHGLLLRRQRNRFIHDAALFQCTYRADADTLSAGDTAGLVQGLTHSRKHNGVKTTFYKSQCTNAHNLFAGTHAQAAQDTFIRVTDDERMIVLALVLVHLPSQTLRFHMVLVCHAHQFTLIVIMAAAFQAAGSLGNGLLLGVALHDLTEVIFSLLRGQLLHLRTALIFPVLKRLSGYLSGGNGILRLVSDRLAVQICINDIASLSGICNGLNGDGNLVVSAVTAGKYARDGCHECILIVNDTFLSGQLQALDTGRVDSLSDGQNDHIHIQLFGLAFHRNRGTSAGSIGLAQLHYLQDHLVHCAVCVLADLQRVGQVFEDDALFLGLFDLYPVSRHLVHGTAVYVVYLLCTEADCGTTGIHSGITAAHDGNSRADLLLLVSCCFSQEINTADNADGILALTAHTGGLPGADSETDSVIFFTDALKGNIRSYFYIGQKGHTHLADPVDLLVQHLLGQTIFRNTVTEHTTGLGHGLVNGYLVAFLTKEVCHGQSVRACADDGNLLACALCDLRDKRIVRCCVLLCGKPFQPCDGYRLIL